MPRYYITGGRQRSARFVRREEWHSFEAAVLVELDTDTGRTRTLLEYETPAAHRPDAEPSILFKSASSDGERLLLSTQTEVLVWHPEHGVERVISLPCFNDVHHVARLGGRLHVVSTGLDAVFVLDADDQIVETHSATGAPPRFDPRVDYRKVPTTKPHLAHPNYVFEHHGRRWVTRFEQRDALCLDGGDRLPVGTAAIHDGVPVGQSVWFTQVSGSVIRTGPEPAVWDLNTMSPTGEPLGWCRGICVEAERVLVGFSRLRPTLFKQNLGWLRGALNRPEPEPTRVSAYDLSAGKLLRSWHLEDAGLSCVFSVLRVGG